MNVYVILLGVIIMFIGFGMMWLDKSYTTKFQMKDVGFYTMLTSPFIILIGGFVL